MYRIEGRPQHNLLDTHYCRLQESRAERKEAMEVLTDLTQRVSAGLATGEQHHEIVINTETAFRLPRLAAVGQWQRIVG